MNMKKIIIGLISLVVLGIAGYFIYDAVFQITDEEQIQTNLVDFARLASRTTGDTTSSNLLKCRQIESLIAPECTVSVRVGMVSGSYSPRSVGAMAMRCKVLFRRAELAFSEILIEVTSPTTAEAEFNASFNGVYKHGGEAEGVRELRCTMKKIEGKWRFDSFSIRDILEK
jgi:hypothetical protein